jgi:hypothetical protein
VPTLGVLSGRRKRGAKHSTSILSQTRDMRVLPVSRRAWLALAVIALIAWLVAGCSTAPSQRIHSSPSSTTIRTLAPPTVRGPEIPITVLSMMGPFNWRLIDSMFVNKSVTLMRSEIPIDPSNIRKIGCSPAQCWPSIVDSNRYLYIGVKTVPTGCFDARDLTAHLTSASLLTLTDALVNVCPPGGASAGGVRLCLLGVPRISLPPSGILHVTFFRGADLPLGPVSVNL